MSLKGKEICFTGALQQMTRSEAAKKAEAAGAIVKKTAVKTLDILVVGEGAGSKAEKGGDADIWDEDAFVAAVSAKGGKAKDKAAPAKKAKKRAATPSDDEDEDEDAGAAPPKSLKGKALCFTGTLSMPRADATKLANAAGANVRSKISGLTEVLVCGANAGSKVNEAPTSCAVISEKVFVKLAKK